MIVVARALRRGWISNSLDFWAGSARTSRHLAQGRARRALLGRQRRQDAQQALSKCARGHTVCALFVFWARAISDNSGHNRPRLAIDALKCGEPGHLIPAPPELVCDRLLRLAGADQAPAHDWVTEKRKDSVLARRAWSSGLAQPACRATRFGNCSVGRPVWQQRSVAHRGNEQSSFASSSRTSSSMRRRSSSSCGAAFCWAGMSRHPHRRPQVTAPSS